MFLPVIPDLVGVYSFPGVLNISVLTTTTMALQAARIMVQLFVQVIVQINAWGEKMLAVNYSTIRSKLKNYCDKATDENETVIVTRKDEKNVVIISLEKYNEIMRAARNAEYLDMIDRSMEQVRQGKVVIKSMAELEEIANE